jgi:hypothetical protein
VPGDFNADAEVDAADYVVWRKGLGSAYSPAGYVDWQKGFGETTGLGVGGALEASAGNSVPEPCALKLCIFGVGFYAARKKRPATRECMAGRRFMG